MKRQIFSIGLLLALFAVGSFAQSRTNRLFRPCPATITPAVVEIERDGDIAITPCVGRDVLINGVVPSAAITFSGASRTTFFPYWSTQTNLDKSGMSFNGLAYSLNNAATNSEFRLDLTTHSTVGSFRVGDFTTTPTTSLSVTQASDTIDLTTTGNASRLLIDGTADVATLSATNSVRIDSPTDVQIGDITGNGTKITVNDGSQVIQLDAGSGANVQIGDVNGVGSGTNFQVDDTAQRFEFNGTAATVQFGDVTNFTYLRTITAGGTTGNRTINQPSGTVNFAAATAAITVTNSTVTATSIVYAIARTNDATCSVKNVVPAAGSFVINMTANCTAETSVGFFVTN